MYWTTFLSLWVRLSIWFAYFWYCMLNVPNFEFGNVLAYEVYNVYDRKPRPTHIHAFIRLHVNKNCFDFVFKCSTHTVITDHNWHNVVFILVSYAILRRVVFVNIVYSVLSFYIVLSFKTLTNKKNEIKIQEAWCQFIYDEKMQ